MMVTLMNHPLSPPQVLNFSAKNPLYLSYSSHGCFSLLNFTAPGVLDVERAYILPIKIKHSRNVVSLSKPTRESCDVSEIGELFSVFRVLGLDERETVVLLEKNPDLRLFPVESIRSRISGLQSVGLNEVALSRLVSKHPDILTAEEVGDLIEFIHNRLENKIESVQIERLFLGTEPRFIAGFDKKVESLIKFGSLEEKICHILNNVNLSKAFCMRSVEDILRMLTFLSRFEAVEIIAKRPTILHYDLDNQLVPRIGFLQKLSGGDTDAVGEVLIRLPAIVSYSVEHLQSHVEFLTSFVGLNDLEIFKIVLVFPNIMSTSVERKLKPRIALLKECGLDTGEIYRFLVKAPLFLGLSFEKNLSLKLAILVKIGYAHRTKDLAMAMGAVTRTRTEYLQDVISLFLGYGFSCDDIVAMSKKHAQILQYNPKSLQEKMEYLVEEMDREIGELLSFPAFLGYNLDNRIKHRYELKKKIVGEDMSLNKLLSVSSKTFSKAKKRLVQVSSKLDQDNMGMD